MSVAIAAALASTAAIRCAGGTTPSVERCLIAERQAAEAEMGRYLAAADRHLRNWRGRPKSGDALADALQAAQAEWAGYRTRQCDLVADMWAGGTIAGSKALGCTVALTRARTRFLWQTFLTYPDSTPPILPDPDRAR